MRISDWSSDVCSSDLVEAFDLRALDHAFLDDPYPVYHLLRHYAPVRQMPDGSYFLTRYDDLQAVYRDPKRFSSDKKVEFRTKFGDTPLYRHHTTKIGRASCRERVCQYV